MQHSKFDFSWILLNGYCNLQCKYCYEVKYGFKNERMTTDTIDASMEFIKKNCAEGAEVGIYGGEPLLDFDLVKYLLEKYPIYNYSMFTNTILMDEEKLEYLYSKQDFLLMDISLDGDEETQIKNRGVMYDKDIVRKIFRRFRHTGVRSIVVDPDRCYDNCRALRDLGAKRIDLNYPSFTDFPDEKYKSVLAGQIEKIKSDPSFNGIFINEPNYCTNNKDELCKIGTGRIAITPSGDIYPCDVFYFLGVYKIGDVFTGIDIELQKSFLEDLEELKDPTRPCPAHVYCSKK